MFANEQEKTIWLDNDNNLILCSSISLAFHINYLNTKNNQEQTFACDWQSKLVKRVLFTQETFFSVLDLLFFSNSLTNIPHFTPTQIQIQWNTNIITKIHSLLPSTKSWYCFSITFIEIFAFQSEFLEYWNVPKFGYARTWL